jgi:hypothetical protein
MIDPAPLAGATAGPPADSPRLAASRPRFVPLTLRREASVVNQPLVVYVALPDLDRHHEGLRLVADDHRADQP